MIGVAIMGYGVIGSGTYKVLRENAGVVTSHVGEEIVVKRVLDLREFPGDVVEPILTHDFNDILNDDDVKIVVEVMGGTGAAYKFVKASLEAGKSVVTSNKALVAAYGPELLQIARDKNINFMFEASVGGGIPIIRPLLRCLTGDEILEISGILNGTTNYILTKMYNEGGRYEDILKEAQKLGYAEADPTADVEGFDAARKIAILASLAAGQFIDFEDIRCTGITGVSLDDMKYAQSMWMKIKLIATAKKENGRYYLSVEPCMVRESSPLFAVDDVMNAILVKGNMLGDCMFYGAGAGSLPTASAVVGDIIEEARHLDRNLRVVMEPEKLSVGDTGDIKESYFLRVSKDTKVNLPVKKKALVNAGEIGIITESVTLQEVKAAGAISYYKVV